MPFRMPKRVKPRRLPAPTMSVDELRKRVRAAISKDGVVATADRLGVQPTTLHRFVAGVSKCHAGTLSLISGAFA